MNLIKKIKYPLTIIILFLIAITSIWIKYKLNQTKYNNLELSENTITLNKQETSKEEKIELCTVDIKGAIKKPGVYQVECTKNTNDVINIAGGLNDNADTSIINLAKKISDQMVIIIYTKEEVKNSNIKDTVVKVIEKECTCPNIQNDSCINDKITEDITNFENSQDSQNSLININQATIEQLQTLPGIGESKARAIIKYRETNGNYSKIEDIQNVDGIGSKLYEEIKIYITT